MLLAVFGVTFVDFYLLKNKLLTFALTYFLFLLLLTRPILLFVMTMSLQTPSIQYQNLPAEVASAIGSVKRQLRRLNASSAGVLVRSFWGK